MTDEPVRWLPPRLTDHTRPVVLTRREAVILTRLCEGLSNQQIARVEHVAVDTVKTQVRAILLRLGARDRVHAAVMAVTGQVDITVQKTLRGAA